tara:strand:+ start:65 stop:364 length:300 start_codon:yes stop_codon:yes gene_type:complete
MNPKQPTEEVFWCYSIMVHNEDHLIGANREDPEYEDALASFWRRIEKEKDDKKKEKKADKVGGKKHKKSRRHNKSHKKSHKKTSRHHKKSYKRTQKKRM